SPPRPSPPLFPYTTLFRSTPGVGVVRAVWTGQREDRLGAVLPELVPLDVVEYHLVGDRVDGAVGAVGDDDGDAGLAADRVDLARSEEHTSELQSTYDLVCR